MTEKELLYNSVVEKMARLIDSGSLAPRSKMPSVRKLQEQMNLSATTIVHAYSILESRGMIESKPRSGYFVCARLAGEIAQPRTPMISAVARPVEVSEFIASVFQSDYRPNVVPFGVALPDPKLLPIQALNRTAARVCRENLDAGARYESPQGNFKLRKQLALRSLGWGLSLTSDDFIITSGAIDALSLALRAVAKAGDTIAIESPTYFGILQIIEGLGMNALEIPCDPENGMNLNILRAALEKNKIRACIVIPNFQNPSGACMTNDDKKELVRLITKYKTPLIEDDIYSDLYFGSQRPLTLKSFDKDGFVLLCSSISKNLAPGYRVGWIVPGRFKDKVEMLKSVVSGGTNSISQMAVAEFMKSGAFDRHLKSFRTCLRSQIQDARAAVARHFPLGTRISNPKGGFVLWIEGPTHLDSLHLQQKALKKGISIAPGPIFSTHHGYKNYIRLSCGQTWNVKSEEAIKKLVTLIEN